MIIESIPMLTDMKEAHTALLEKNYSELAEFNDTIERYNYIEKQNERCKKMILQCDSLIKAYEYAGKY